MNIGCNGYATLIQHQTAKRKASYLQSIAQKYNGFITPILRLTNVIHNHEKVNCLKAL